MSGIRYLSVCSGIEAATVAWHPLGWTPVAFSEIEPFPSAVLAHHYPDTPNLGDMTKFKEWPDYADLDVLVGGTPCQSFSVAGLREGMADPRGNLALVYLAIVARYRPRWVVWENVPGVLSADGGQALGAFLGGLAELGYGFAYRVLDAQYFGLAQRRKRVFVVGCLGDWRRAAAVLLEPESLRGDPPPRRKSGKRAAPTLAARTRGGGGLGTDFDCDGGLVVGGGVAPTGVTIHGTDGTASVASLTDVAGALRARAPGGQENSSTTAVLTHAPDLARCDATREGTSQDYETTTMVPMAFTCKDSGQDVGPLAPTLRAQGEVDGNANGGGQVAVAIPYDLYQITAPVNRQARQAGDPCHTLARDNAAHAAIVGFNNRQDPAPSGLDISPLGAKDNGLGVALAFQLAGDRDNPTVSVSEEQAFTLPANPMSDRGQSVVAPTLAVRRLMPRECERLQGFPDDHTLIPYRGKPASDGPRYRALGNSMAVPVMRWIGERIQQAEAA